LLYCKEGKKPAVLLTSSAQATLDNEYGKSKKAAEELAVGYEKSTGVQCFVYRLPGVFGKWCRPNYNSVVATFCNNIARGLPISVNDPNAELTLAYIDDVMNLFSQALKGKKAELLTYTVTLARIKELLESFHESRKTLSVLDVSNEFVKKLHATYLSYLPIESFLYPLKMNVDERGSFTEILRTAHHGQFSVNITKPGITRGNHWHHTKCEKFVVVSGEGVVRFRNIMPFCSNDIIEYKVSGTNMEVIDIPPGYTHNIENTGKVDLVAFMWCNEQYDPNRPDTLFVEV